jgi:alanyl-tRNA synthetase
VGGRPAVTLDRTCFYPASGGQPADTGALNGARVVDVQTQGGAILHILEGELAEGAARGEIDWARRFDHMQQHTGQHILSQAFLRAAEAETVSFHLSPDSVTIDLAAQDLPPAALARAEDLANEVVLADTPVRAWFPTAAELAGLALRRTPDGLAPGALRVVAIGDFDYNACGGTHVARAGEIGQIKVVRAERRGAATRVEFRCGLRALDDYRRKNDLALALAADFTCGWDEVPQAVARLRAEAQAARHALKIAREQLLDHEAAELLALARPRNGWRVVRRAWPGREPTDLRALAARLAAQPGAVALLGNAGDKAQIVLARAADVATDMRPALQTALAALGGGRGGGNSALAQGGGGAAQLAAVEGALAQAEAELAGPG